jgi:stage III sporulation protein SpoIIIAA
VKKLVDLLKESRKKPIRESARTDVERLVIQLWDLHTALRTALPAYAEERGMRYEKAEAVLDQLGDAIQSLDNLKGTR